ncbi:MAG: cysteine desulfurase, partial [Bacteroidales bacterium]|nr:cysteine desulfurase [Bacteroidales bacterium]MDY2704915.1 cysteine desulfurase [Alloprevotella sp.]
MDDDGNLDMAAYEALFNERTRLVSVAHVSNVLGTVNPIREMAQLAHAYGAHLLADGAQSVPHFQVDVQDLGVDFLTFSGHKMYGPTGIGVLYGRRELLEQMPPYQGGGEMIKRVTFERTTYEELPYKFEAGTPDYVGSHALAVAIQYIESIGREKIHAHEQDLLRYALEQMDTIPGMHIYGRAREKDAVIAFNIQGIHHLDLGTLLDRLGIAIRTGHHCAQPLMERCGVEGMARASFALYNTREEVDAFVAGLRRVQQMF